MPITFRQLEIFIAVAETQQVTRASKKLFLTQSAVSMALGELENQLGAPLFDRRGRSLLLNDRGRYLLPMAKDITFQVWNIESMLNEKRELVAGSLEIIASSTIGNYVLPYLIGTFMRLHPETRINMLVANTNQAEKLVCQGVMDLGFVEGSISNDMVKAVPWFEDELVIIFCPSHPLAEKKSFQVPDDLQETVWVMREEGSGTAETFKNKLGKHVVLLEVVTKMGHTEAIKKAVESGIGAACLSELTICRETGQGWLKSLTIEGIDMHRQLRIIQHRDKVTTRLMDEFLSFCAVMTENLGMEYLASPWKLQNLLNQYSKEKNE
ncbi:MAG: LysR substrate-binding domain-containing protein [Thermodesulfobacteriota bacterium]|nr:LysR substrate-binding domain-containing protein [Thermodesulfobacteriota bacterium]